ncbi:MAG: beta-propeller domain-containing protein [Salinirussus sp.]
MERNPAVVGIVLVGLVLGSAFALVVVGTNPGDPAPTDPADSADPTATPAPDPGANATDDSLPTFEDRAAFVAYVGRADPVRGSDAVVERDVSVERGVETTTDRESVANVQTATPVATATAVADATPGVETGDGDTGAASTDRRVGTTNVQVRGVDEPDIVKTDGRHFYYAPAGRVRPKLAEADAGDVREDVVVETDATREPSRPQRLAARTHVLDTSTPADPRAVAAVDATGTLLRVGDSLVVLGSETVRGYDVSDPGDPEQTWSRSLNGSLVTARATGGTVYLVTESPARVAEPCPIEPLGGVEVACTDVHHPPGRVPVDATYTTVALDPASGDVAHTTSFVGTAENTVVHMAGRTLYVTYTKPVGRTDVLVGYVTEESDLVPERIRDRVREIASYDISRASKRREIGATLERWLGSLSEQRRREVTERFHENVRTYAERNKRQFTRTGIVRVNVSDGLTIERVGEVPGRPLNQFSLSHHDGRLRIATTIPRIAGADSENDLYVLDATTLDRIGAETGMGETEQVYAVRYVGDTAYVVTFRRVDPFHVVDLSDPTDPEEVGKLKLPGFSSYLHPVDEDHVLGIGEEDGEVKAVLFDVSDPSNPTIDDTLRLDAGWSAIARSHHAFMQDRRHGVVFLPAGDQGLVVDYTGGDLDVEKRVRADQPVTRARYVGDYLYVFAGDTVTVLDERDWTRVSELSV